ncbi:hypothetical protein BofuT4_uP088720.1 [Botrytis cinerea T4]|uniref:Uncharacterized protein n=1 Tax=Botryotinia fuckeliana (strain T4) TaxID=999810 RepID=G2YFC5_BOTF4|nr:hypothetical protein BofuT4_uP088720.1 [Botrytis cinerea T4]
MFILHHWIFFVTFVWPLGFGCRFLWGALNLYFTEAGNHKDIHHQRQREYDYCTITVIRIIDNARFLHTRL